MLSALAAERRQRVTSAVVGDWGKRKRGKEKGEPVLAEMGRATGERGGGVDLLGGTRAEAGPRAAVGGDGTGGKRDENGEGERGERGALSARAGHVTGGARRPGRTGPSRAAQ